MRPPLAAVVTTTIAFPLLVLVATESPSAAGPPASAEFLVNTTTTSGQERPAIAMDAEGDSVIAWEAGQDGDQLGIYAQRYDADGTPLGVETRINTYTTGSQQDPRVAMDADGDYVITWDSGGLQDGSGSGVYAQRFAADGTPRGAEMRVNTTTTDSQSAPQVAMDADGDYVITWQSYLQDGSSYGIYAQRYSAAGVPRGVETRVNTTTADIQRYPSVAMDADGDYVIAWDSAVAGGSAIEFQRYAPDGTAVGNETQANTTVANYPHRPSLAIAADGDFVAAWESAAADGFGSGVYGQRFDAGGTAVGSEVHVSTTTYGDQDFPAVAMAADGGYAITWESWIQDGSDLGIITRRFSAAGASVGGETRVNTFTAGEQRQPAIAMDADGDHVIAWTSLAQDGDAYGVYARRFRGAGGVDLALTQSESDDPVTVGDHVTYRVLVANQEEASVDTGVPAIDAAVGLATGVYVVSTIPEGATYVSGDGHGWDCHDFAAVVRCRLASSLPADETAPTLLLTYEAPKDAGPLLHRARVYEQQLDPDATNDTETERTAVRCSIELTNPSYSTLEAGSLSVSVTRHGSSCGTSSVQYETIGGTATEGSDYGGVADTLTWTDADTDLSFAVPILSDSIDEKTEQFKLRLSNATGALLGRRTLANASIADNDPPPRLNFTTTSSTAGEPGALVHVTAELSEESGQQVTVDLNRTGTATAGADYFSATKLTIPAGRTSVTFTVEVADDVTVEPNETAVLTFAAPVGATIGSQRTYRLTITSDD